MLTIRLQRTGKKNQADFRIVLAEKHKSVSKKFKEILGSFNPRKKLFRIISETRVKELIGQNVNISPTVHNLFVSQGLLQGNKVQSFKIKKKKEEKQETGSKNQEKQGEQGEKQIKDNTQPAVESKLEEKAQPDNSIEEKKEEEKPEDKPKEEPKPEKKEEEVKTEDQSKPEEKKE